MIQGLIIKKILNKSTHDGGKVNKIINYKDIEYQGFQELYFTRINPLKIRGWKMHKKMTSNLLVISGKVLFVFKDLRKKSETYNEINQITLNSSITKSIIAPPNIWFGFQGLFYKESLICNFSNLMHNDSEVLKKPLNHIKFSWKNNI